MNKIDANGRLFIPEKFKDILNLKNGDAVEIYIRKDKEIVIKGVDKSKDESEKVEQYFKIPVEWSSAGIVRIKAKTLEDAVKKFDNIKKRLVVEMRKTSK